MICVMTQSGGTVVFSRFVFAIVVPYGQMISCDPLCLHSSTLLLLHVVFFFSAPFSRRRSLVDDCFTGQPPGNAISIPAAPDVYEGPGQMKASALYGRAGRRLVGGGGGGALLTEAG